MSTIGIVIVRSGLVPSKVAALGIEFTQADQRALLGVLGAVVVYYLIAFTVYAATDFVAWRVALYNAIEDVVRARSAKDERTLESE